MPDPLMLRALRRTSTNAKSAATKSRLCASRRGCLRELRADAEPRAGFYARVMERIETQGRVPSGTLFRNRRSAGRIAVASMALVLLPVLILVTSDRYAEHDHRQSDRPFISGDSGRSSAWAGADAIRVFRIATRCWSIWSPTGSSKA